MELGIPQMINSLGLPENRDCRKWEVKSHGPGEGLSLAVWDVGSPQTLLWELCGFLHPGCSVLPCCWSPCVPSGPSGAGDPVGGLTPFSVPRGRVHPGPL